MQNKIMNSSQKQQLFVFINKVFYRNEEFQKSGESYGDIEIKNFLYILFL